MGNDLGSVRDWIARLDAGRRDDTRYSLTWTEIGGRSIGRNRVPDRASVTSFDQAWALLGVSAQVRRFDDVLAHATHPPVRAWAAAHPFRAIDVHGDIARLVVAYEWLDRNRGSLRYVREITAPGIDTKFVERNRSTLAGMLGVRPNPADFLADLALRSRPEFIRLRCAASLGLASPLSELAAPAEELRHVTIQPRRAFVIENEITYLSVPVPADGIVLWGKGFEVDRIGRLPWLKGVDVDYWGDIDTHGFAILDRLRAWLPQTQSVLMDRATLVEHRERWATEERPSSAALTRLGAEEQELYAELVEDRLGDRVRLEQERIDWRWVIERLPEAGGWSGVHGAFDP